MTVQTVEIQSDLRIGDVMPEGHEHAGRIYVGISRMTAKPLYAAPRDSGVFQWREAMNFAAREDASVPCTAEINQLYEVQKIGALNGTFNSGSDLSSVYWSSTKDHDGAKYAHVQWFDTGTRGWDHFDRKASLRLVWS